MPRDLRRPCGSAEPAVYLCYLQLPILAARLKSVVVGLGRSSEGKVSLSVRTSLLNIRVPAVR